MLLCLIKVPSLDFVKTYNSIFVVFVALSIHCSNSTGVLYCNSLTGFSSFISRLISACCLFKSLTFLMFFYNIIVFQNSVKLLCHTILKTVFCNNHFYFRIFHFFRFFFTFFSHESIPRKPPQHYLDRL